MSEARHTPWVHRFAVVLAVLTLVLVSAGALVTSKGAGLAVPDWPTSYGGFNPPGWLHIPNVRAEHGHRLIAGVVALLTLAFAIVIQRTDSRSWVRRFAWFSFGLVIFQALLGGLTVLHFTPALLSAAHGFTGQTFLCSVWLLALFTSRSWCSPLEPGAANPDGGVMLRRACYILIGTLYVQLVIGALVRHTESYLAIPDFPLVYGGLFPKFSGTWVHNVNVDRQMEMGLDEVTRGQIWLHFAHRAWAVAVVAAIGLTHSRIFKRKPLRPELAIPAMIIGVLLIAQIVLGAAIIWTGRQPHVATTHVATGAAILATTVLMTAQAIRLTRVPEGTGANP